MIRTAMCNLLGIKYPILGGGMGENEGAGLAAAISNAGGLGCIRESVFRIIGVDPKEVLNKEIDEAKTLTDKPFAVNILPTAEEKGSFAGLLDLVLDKRRSDEKLSKQLAAILTSGGDASPYVEKIKKEGLVHIHKISNVKQAKKMERAGVDFLIVMGHEAAGHLGFDNISTLVLVPMIVDAVKTSVIASGGFCDAASFVAALALGAEGIEMGTRLMCTHEAGFHPNVKKTVVEAEAKDTEVLPCAFSNLRYYKNSFAADLREQTGGVSEDQITDKKFHEELNMLMVARMNVYQLRLGDMDKAPLPIGQVCGRIHSVLSVKEVIDGIMEGAEKIIRDLPTRIE